MFRKLLKQRVKEFEYKEIDQKVLIEKEVSDMFDLDVNEKFILIDENGSIKDRVVFINSMGLLMFPTKLDLASPIKIWGYNIDYKMLFVLVQLNGVSIQKKL